MVVTCQPNSLLFIDLILNECAPSLDVEEDMQNKKSSLTCCASVCFTDAMSFNQTGLKDSQLKCEVNVSKDPRVVLSIVHNGDNQSADFAPGAFMEALPYITLSANSSLRSGGKYECQLHLNQHLITKSVFIYHPPQNNTPQLRANLHGESLHRTTHRCFYK